MQINTIHEVQAQSFDLSLFHFFQSVIFARVQIQKKSFWGEKIRRHSENFRRNRKCKNASGKTAANLFVFFMKISLLREKEKKIGRAHV